MGEIFISTGIILFLIAIATVVLLFKLHRKVEQGQALIVNTMKREPIVTFTGMMVIPVIHKAEVMDISLKTLEIDRRGTEGLICKDNIRADIKVAFFVRVNKTQQDVLKVAGAIGCARASDQETMDALFSAKFSEALKTVGKQMEFEDLYKERDAFRDRIIDLIGKDLNGYVLEDAAIDYLEQTPLTSMDPKNVLDARGIRKITQLTAEQRVLTNEIERDGEMRITKKNVETKETILELERQEKNAEAKQLREIGSIEAREQAETNRVRSEEQQRAAEARIKAEEQVAVQEENKQREIEVAEKNRERVIAIETEKVVRSRELEIISREREVELQRIAKERSLEEERKAIADVIRERIAVEKTVAEEEERIKELRLIAEADRHRQVRIIEAEAEAQQHLVADIKAAEAAQQAAGFKAQERLTLVEAELEASDKQAQAKIREAEGVQAEQAAKGLAQVRVDEANVAALEKKGLAQANILRETKQAEADGKEQVGLAEARVREHCAQVTEKEGLIKAKIEREQLLAIAAGKEQQGLAQVRVQEAEADAIEKRALAEAIGIKARMLAEVAGTKERLLAEAQGTKERLQAEAVGLTEKLTALEGLGGEGRAFEEFRLRLEQQHTIELKSITANKEIAAHQAGVLAEVFKTAKIDIVGGDGVFFQRLLQATTLGKSVDRVVEGSDTARHLLKDYLSGEANLIADLKEVLTRPALSSEDVQRLSLATFLQHLSKQGGTEQQSNMKKLMGLAKHLGVDDLQVDSQ